MDTKAARRRRGRRAKRKSEKKGKDESTKTKPPQKSPLVEQPAPPVEQTSPPAKQPPLLVEQPPPLVEVEQISKFTHVSSSQEADTELANNNSNEIEPLVNNIPSEVSDSVSIAPNEDLVRVDTFSTRDLPSSFLPIPTGNSIQTISAHSSSPSLGLILGLAIPSCVLFLLFTTFLAFSYRRNKKQLIARQRKAQAPILSVSIPKDGVDAFFARPDSVHKG
jgi:hypothetical protein